MSDKKVRITTNGFENVSHFPAQEELDRRRGVSAAEAKAVVEAEERRRAVAVVAARVAHEAEQARRQERLEMFQDHGFRIADVVLNFPPVPVQEDGKTRMVHKSKEHLEGLLEHHGTQYGNDNVETMQAPATVLDEYGFGYGHEVTLVLVRVPDATLKRLAATSGVEPPTPITRPMPAA
jgi:hypothetical protein